MSAKSRRDEKPVFEFPEFDKEEYIEKEFRDAKASRMVIFLALAIAFISYGLVRIDTGYRIVGLLLIFGAVAMLKDFLQLLKIDISAFEKKNWIGNSLLLFFAWFGMFTLLLNPPFYDLIDPQVESVNFYTLVNETSDNVTYLEDDAPALNSTISVNATVVDNNRVDAVSVTITYPDNTTKESRDLEKTKVKDRDDEYTAGTMVLSQRGTYTFTFFVEDGFGNSRYHEAKLKVA